MELERIQKTSLDISSPAEVLTFTYTGQEPREVTARVDLGIAPNVLAGAGGTYVLDFFIDNVLITPSSQVIVPGGTLKTIMIGRSIPLETGDVVSVKVTGTGGDTNVDTLATLRGATPVLAGEIKGIGSVLVDHDFGGTDTLRIVTPDGNGIRDATVAAYLESDYNAGNRAATAIRGQATTGTDGRWLAPMSLDPGAHVLVFSKQGEFASNTRTVQVA